MTEALIGLGGNVGGTREILNQAIAMFCDGEQVRLISRSSDYRTKPWGVSDQPPFINICLSVETILDPRNLLSRAQEVERAFGRDRSKEQRWGQRAVDIDILTYDDLTLADEDLTLPHPRLFDRAFVIVPLAEIVPEHFISGVRIRDAVTQVDRTGIEKLTPRRTIGTKKG
jgi:2-amino-4-hydroxy-6-hydroxymethyldihydropteridine diphosphokinase